MDFYREMPVSISEKQYTFTKFCRDHITRRLAFDDLAQSIFGLSFEPWYQNGHWSDKYIPYTLFDGDLAVANVSVNTMTFTSANAGRLHGIQLGTVMTHPAYRGRGLSRFLMEQVLAEWKDKWDFLYLFANDTVLDFYPQFGFYPVKESCYQKHTPHFSFPTSVPTLHKLHMDIPEDRRIFTAHLSLSNPFSSFQMADNPGLVMFYADRFLKDAVYYLPAYDERPHIQGIYPFNASITVWGDFSGSSSQGLGSAI